MTVAASREGRELVVNRDINPLLSDLPEKFARIQPHQITAINQIMAAFERVDVVVVDAPTGSGKTLIGEVVRRLMRVTAPYICSTKNLQEQLLNEFPYAKLLMGRGNYPTQMYRSSFHPSQLMGHVSCEDCTWSVTTPCRWCVNKAVCPYEAAKREALAADLAIINSAYFLAEANSAGKFSRQELVIVDEADVMEEVLMRHVSVHVGERRLSQWGWRVPERVTVKDSYREWLEARVEDLIGIAAAIPPGEDPALERERRYVREMRGRMRLVMNGLDTDAWTYTGRKNEDRKGDGASFKPARVDFLGAELMWRHGEKWLLMSGTVISSRELVEWLGLGSASHELVRVPNVIPVENRRVILRPIANMAMKHKHDSWPKMAVGVREVLKLHPGSRVLIHSVSYAFTKFLASELRGLGRPVIHYSNPLDRQGALAQYRGQAAAVLIAPSFDRGVDLVGDDCRVQLIPKVPYPYLGDRQVSARMHAAGGRVWYNIQAVRKIVQMAGRGVRGPDDWAVTYIMDEQFKGRLWNEARNLFPTWFVEALVWR